MVWGGLVCFGVVWGVSTVRTKCNEQPNQATVNPVGDSSQTRVLYSGMESKT